MEEKTARGTKLTARVSNSPKTPRFKKLATPRSKRQRFEVFPTTEIGTGTGEGYPPHPLVPIELEIKSGKVSSELW